MNCAVVGPRLLTLVVTLVALAPAVQASSPSDQREPWRVGSLAVTPNAELRLRETAFDGEALVAGNDSAQARLRLVLGADARLNRHLRVLAEIGTGQVTHGAGMAPPNVRNAIAVQQLYAEATREFATMRSAVVLGRQEFADGPRQLISVSDGPNLHRTWNGVRIDLQGARARWGLFNFRATRLGRGGFDESVDASHRLQGMQGSIALRRSETTSVDLDAFWFHTRMPAVGISALAALDARDTVGLRVRGRRGRLAYDAVAAHQTGRDAQGRTVDAWAIFALHGLDLANTGWKPRLTSRIDLASGSRDVSGGGSGTFNPLYASSSHVGEGQFLGLSNVAMVAPGLTLSPSPRTTLVVEHALAWRLEERDAIYAGGLRAYRGTASLPGSRIGALSRLSATFRADARWTLRFNVEHLSASTPFGDAGFASGSFAYLDATYRY